MRFKSNLFYRIGWITLIFFLSCKPKEKPELLIYCGITMIEPMNEISAIFEKTHYCHVEIVKGGTGTLLQSIRKHQNGDLFLPGSADYYNQMNRHEYIDSATLGYNTAVIMVAKSNPNQIYTLDQLTDSNLRVVISNPNSGSIGAETKRLLSQFGNYDKVLSNAKQITADSKDLTRLLMQGQADVAINWSAEAFKNGHKNHLDIVKIDSQFANPTPIVLCVLKFSQNQELSLEFLKFASSGESKEIFEKYGF